MFVCCYCMDAAYSNMNICMLKLITRSNDILTSDCCYISRNITLFYWYIGYYLSVNCVFIAMSLCRHNLVQRQAVVAVNEELPCFFETVSNKRTSLLPKEFNTNSTHTSLWPMTSSVLLYSQPHYSKHILTINTSIHHHWFISLSV